ncbi:MAG: autotransporter-associated beta strand repeat-containing protein [Phycisphaeraceae bacterium]
MVVTGGQTQAADITYTWKNSAANSNWNDPANWDANGVPVDATTSRIEIQTGGVAPVVPVGGIVIGANAYPAPALKFTGTGSFTLTGGAISVSSPSYAYTTVNNASGRAQTINNNFVVSSTNVSFGNVGAGSLTINGDIDAGGAATGRLTLEAFGTGSSIFNGVISNVGGAGAVVLLTGDVAAPIVMNGANSYTTQTEIRQGMVLVGADVAPGVNGPLGNYSGGIYFGNVPAGVATASLLTNGAYTISVNSAISSTTNNTIFGGATADVSTISGNITGETAAAAAPRITMTAVAGGQVNFSGSFIRKAGQTGTNDSLTKTGLGIVNMTGNASTYQGGTFVTQGTLLVNNTTGSGTGTGSVSVDNGATLGGSGLISGPVTVSAGGILAPGNSAGTLTISNILVLAGNADFELAADTSFDKVVGVTDITFGGVLNVVNYNGGPAYAAGQVYDLFDWSGTPAGAFTAVNLPALPVGLVWKTFDTQPFDYATGQIVVEIPEPATLGLLALGGLMMANRRNK